MFKMVLIMACSMAVGFLLRRHRLLFLGRLTTVLIWLLLFILGLEVGSNERLVKALPTLGVESLLITLFALGGCMAGSLLLWRLISKEPHSSGKNAVPSDSGNDSGNDSNPLKGSLVIVSFFAAGCLMGAFVNLPFQVESSGVSFYALACLMASVGLNLGNDPETVAKFRSLNPKLLWLPVTTLAGTLAGSFAVSFILPERGITDCLAVGSGMGYYSLSSIFITQYRGAELGTIALLSNIFREIITLLFAPLMVRVFGPLAPISSGGATTMDTTFPVIIRCCGDKMAVVSLCHGFLMDFSVPFLVTLFCSF